MNQVKIGKFIQERRKLKNLTQSQLADKLGITDRAVSKWENGRGLPDTSLMLDLCEVLEIAVNELLSGEVIKVNDYEKKAEEKLLEMAKREEAHNKKMMLAMWVILITDVLFYAGTLLLSAKLFGESTKFNVIVVVATLIFLVIGFIALKFEIETGYYECKKCRHRFVPSYTEVFLSMHYGTTRYLKCPKCGKRSWCKKKLTKE